ncbi:unnamed protein product [Parascedosporium putredinis]|uniref:Uncharacterized protein n=1 Tax=Parascedosporium putredinis TaxID=1442378 RepID=A0A9P1M8V2_9PEZI|nr:unnamed protein product [Parascedosporium putredinis]CAI7990642.1 unnamed protein product [Parascedosporium putredinis]
MPTAFLFYVIEHGFPPILRDNASIIFKTLATLTLFALIKWISNGASYPTERKMHGKVVMITGARAQLTKELAKRGAQIVLLTQVAPSDPFLAEFIDDIREQTGNDLVYAEQVDLASLHSVRQFATKWIDNAPPRRLDMIVLPAIRAQPFDRDVRIVIATCASYIGSPPLREKLDRTTWSPGRAYARSKLALMVFGRAFQKHLDAYKRPDELPMNARVIFVDPGLSRTPGTRRWLTRGSLTGLALYLIGYLPVWLLLKSPHRAAHPFLYAAMDPELGRIGGGRLVKECRLVDFARTDLDDEDAAKNLWEGTDKYIEKIEKEQAMARAKDKLKQEEMVKRAAEAEKAEEIGALVDAIKKGKQKEKEKTGTRKRTKKTT